MACIIVIISVVATAAVAITSRIVFTYFKKVDFEEGLLKTGVLKP
jgi:hypothetical protein